MELLNRYKALVWWTMDVVGVSRSVWWKILMAVGIQFAAALALALVPLAFSGWLRVEVTLALFVLTLVAFGNTVLIVRDDIIQPLRSLQATCAAIAEGNLDTESPTSDQDDEVGDLVRSFESMCGSLDVIAAKADVLKRQEFDDPALEGDIPGEFGESFDEMAASLERYIERIEADRDRLELLNYLVGHDIPNLISVIYGRIDALQMTVEDPEATEHVDIIEEQTEEIEVISNTVGKLTSEKSMIRTNVVDKLEDSIDRDRDSFPKATIATDLPDRPVYVRGNELLTRVFENLVTNGIEHNSAEQPRVEVSLTKRESTMEIAFEDNGPGLDVADPDQFFESLTPGTGLNIVYTVVRRFGGEVTIPESGAEGTEFLVSLPVMENAHGDTASEQRTAAPFRSE